MTKTKIVTINTGKATHIAHSYIDGNGNERWSVPCGVQKHGSNSTLRNAHSEDEVTCKKCLARMEEEKPVVEGDMSLKEYCERFGSTTSIDKMTKKEVIKEEAVLAEIAQLEEQIKKLKASIGK